MHPEPHVTFASDPRRGLVARSGWEQEEARTVLRDLGWEWDEHVHAMMPPDDADPSDAGVQAVLELHRHGHLTGYRHGPYGTLQFRLAEADRVFTQIIAGKPSAATNRPETPDDGPSRRATGGTPPSYADKYAGNVDNEAPGRLTTTPEL
ncbi:hypothetical protein [Streptomyces sp. GS7]|uniref:hypothetical protein n=1 Tax=Streptomyces sp. GS7 TaxID=2692234 RepID=UPI0013162D1B|nr:hypothetical protein [Streptomyces sp. GS7]QHC26368.1 hypothetical protein GR130_38395 [Streptomyces sp. GS7]